MLTPTSTSDATGYLKDLGYSAPDAKEIQGAKDELDPLVGQVNGLSATVDGLLASSKNARADFSHTSSKLDGMINTTAPNYGMTVTDPNTGKVTSPNGSINAEGAQAGMGFKFAYQADGTKVQIPEGSTPEQYGMTSTPPSPTNGAKAGANGTTGAPVDPYAQALTDYSANLEKSAQDRQTKDDAWQARLDSTLQSLVQSVEKKYEARRLKMEDINARMLEGKRISGIQAGRQRYTPGMEEGLLSTEEMDGQARLAEIDAEELSLIAQAKQARDEASYKAFSDSMDRLDTLAKEKLDTVTRLHDAAIAADKAIEDKRKNALTEQQSAFNYQQDQATAYAPSAYAQLQTLKSEKEKEAYIQELAKSKSIDPEVLRSAIAEYQNKEETQNSQITARDNAASAREQSLTIQEQRLALQAEKQNGGGDGKSYTDGKLTYTGSDLSTSEDLLQNGGEFNGVKYNPSGSKDGFSDPYLYQALYDYWIKNGGTKAGFVKEFPPKTYVNPAAKNLPEFLMPE